jgi:hypothetical protein
VAGAAYVMGGASDKSRLNHPRAAAMTEVRHPTLIMRMLSDAESSAPRGWGRAV